MRILLAIAVVASVAGCSNTAGVKQPTLPDQSHKIPVVREAPTRSDRMLLQRLQEEQAAAGKINVEGTILR